ncbi:MAG: zinc carboxypeptidase, partial [Eudoraea sp.]|nr:zinc carboxypeptidase [Eudoraea sp.]
VKKGNTLITIGTASEWIIKKKWVKEKLIETKTDTTKAPVRKAYVDAGENLGKQSVGGIIVEVDLDISHPLGFGYRNTALPVYKNNTVWLAPSQNEYATVAKYTQDPHIDGFITKRNLQNYLKPAASLIVSPMGSGRVVLFADNPNFRGSWYGTNRLFLNALFLGKKITVPKRN